jgi:hypothetical protein
MVIWYIFWSFGTLDGNQVLYTFWSFGWYMYLMQILVHIVVILYSFTALVHRCKKNSGNPAPDPAEIGSGRLQTIRQTK